VTIVATDLNPPMLAQAQAVGTARPVSWRQADAMQLPFADGSFNAVVCQFDAMFFPDKAQAFSEARRVLRSGGVFLFNVWDRIEGNEFADVVTTALAGLFPDDPPRFLARTPHGHGDPAPLAQALRAAGFTSPAQFSTVTARSRAASAAAVALAYCQGTPLRNEIEARDASRLSKATDLAAEALTQRFGRGEVDGQIQALVVSVER
jgi:ubiquinone/menaquinone biosynthesis C-methylase UbiE